MKILSGAKNRHSPPFVPMIKPSMHNKNNFIPASKNISQALNKFQARFKSSLCGVSI